MYPPLYIDIVPYYCSLDIELFGPPELFGVEEYHVVEKDKSFVLDYELEQYYFGAENGGEEKIHHYDRVERFERVLLELGGHLKIKQCLLDEIATFEFNPNCDKVWTSLKQVLRELGKPKLYNRIPYIVKMFGGGDMIIANSQIWFQVKTCFEEMSRGFGTRKTVHFPPLRFVALKLLAMHGARFMYFIPLVLTRRKRGKMDQDFVNLLSHISKRQPVS
jgi:hypothetical protein